MKAAELIQKIKQQAKPAAVASFNFLKAEFSDKKNLVRFALAGAAIVITSQLLPERKIIIAGWGVTLFLILSYIATMISASRAIAKIKLPFNTYTYGLYLLAANFLLMWFYDWGLWYFETEGPLWIALFSGILAVFNGIIEDLLKDDTH